MGPMDCTCKAWKWLCALTERMSECPEYTSAVFFRAKCVRFSSRWLCRKHLAALYTWVCAEHSASSCGNIICTSRILSQLKVKRASSANSGSDPQTVVTMAMVGSFPRNREPSAQDQNLREGTSSQNPNWNRKSQCFRKVQRTSQATQRPLKRGQSG